MATEVERGCVNAGLLTLRTVHFENVAGADAVARPVAGWPMGLAGLSCLLTFYSPHWWNTKKLQRVSFLTPPPWVFYIPQTALVRSRQLA